MVLLQSTTAGCAFTAKPSQIQEKNDFNIDNIYMPSYLGIH